MGDGLWSAQRRALTGGLVLTVTFVAAEALAVVTVMPVVARDLHGLGLYGFVFSAFLLGTMIGIVAAGLAILAGAVLIALGIGVGVPLLRRLMPPGTLTARYGLPATILTRSLVTFAFFGADAFVTLTITILRHHSPVVAGVAVTGSTLAWTAGAWVQAKMNVRWEGRRLIRIGLSIILAGIAGLALMLASQVSIVEGIVAWTIAGLGMGLSYAPITLLMLDAAPAGREGWASASLNLADVLGSALGIGIGGAAISAAVSLGWPLASGVAVAFVITAAAAVTGLGISRRLPLRGIRAVRTTGTAATTTAATTTSATTAIGMKPS